MDFEVSMYRIDKNGNKKYWDKEDLILINVCTKFYEKLYQIISEIRDSVPISTVKFIIEYKNICTVKINGCTIISTVGIDNFKNILNGIIKMMHFIDYRSV